MHIQTMKDKLHSFGDFKICSFGDFKCELNALVFAFKTSIEQYKYEQ